MLKQVAKSYEKFYSNEKYYFPMFHEYKNTKFKLNSPILNTCKL